MTAERTLAVISRALEWVLLALEVPTDALSLESLADALSLESLADALSLDPVVVGVILAMAAVTVLAKVGGIWIVRHVELSDRLEAGLEVLPGAIVIAVLGPELAEGGPAEWAAAGVVLLVMWRTGSIVLSLLAGVIGVVGFRTLV